MIVEQIAERLRDGRASQADIDHILDAVSNEDYGFANRIIGTYIKYSADIQSEKIIETLLISRCPEFVAETIKELSYRGIRDDRVNTMIIEASKHLDWDTQNDVQIASLLVLPFVLDLSGQIKVILSKSFRSDDKYVRQSGIVSAQRYLKYPEKNIIWKSNLDSLPKDISNNIIKSMVL